MSLKLGLRNKIRRSRAGGFTGLLDQSFATGATAAYSLRKLKSSATKAVRVREDSGNTETDIGFSGGALDTTALLNHVGSNNGFVTKWYDQSGNGYDASNSAASEQPKIISSGSVIKENGLPALNFDGADDYLHTQDADFTSSQPNTIFAIQKLSSGSSNGYSVDSYDSGGARQGVYRNNGAERIFAGAALNSGIKNSNQIIKSALFASPNSILRINGTQKASGNAGSNDLKGLSIGVNNLIGTGFSAYFAGTQQEILVYTEDKSGNFSGIENNCTNHYSIS